MFSHFKSGTVSPKPAIFFTSSKHFCRFSVTLWVSRSTIWFLGAQRTLVSFNGTRSCLWWIFTFFLSCHLSFCWLCPHSSALFRLVPFPVLFVSIYHLSPSFSLHLCFYSGPVIPNIPVFHYSCCTHLIAVADLWAMDIHSYASATSAQKQQIVVIFYPVLCLHSFCVGFLHRGLFLCCWHTFLFPSEEQSFYTNTAMWRQLAWKLWESSLTDLLKGTGAISSTEMKTPNNPFPKTRQKTQEKCNLHSANVSLPVFSGNLKVNKKSNLNFTRENKPIRTFHCCWHSTIQTAVSMCYVQYLVNKDLLCCVTLDMNHFIQHASP